MAATDSASAVKHNDVENVLPNEWEDERDSEKRGAAPVDSLSGEQPRKAKNLRSAAAVLRSSFSGIRPSSAYDPNVSSSGRRESTTGFVGSLLHGLANAVGLHRENSPARQSSTTDVSVTRSKHSGQTRTLARLSSAAMMRTEIQNLGQFGDLRNDSFTSPSCAKIRRRTSLLLPRVSDASISVPTPQGGTGPPPGFLMGNSGDLDRRSAPLPPYIASLQLTCPGELASTRDTSPTSAVPYPHNSAAAAPTPALPAPPALAREHQAKAGATASAAAAASLQRDVTDGGAAAGCDGVRMRRFSYGGPPVRGGSLTVDTPLMPSTLSPHPPLHPPPQTRPSGSSLSPFASRSTSTDHLPPMTPLGCATSGGGGGGGLQNVRDRPPTPRGGTSSGSPTSALAKVFGSFHLPEILHASSGRSVTERRSSIAGGGGAVSTSFTRPADFGMPRSRRNSVCSGPSVTGPGGAAISASLAKRAATVAAAAEAPVGGGGGGGGNYQPLVAPSGSSWTNLSRPSAPAVTGRTGSYSKPSGGILQDFHSSLELDEDSALAAVDAEFDRRFGQPPPDVPDAMDGATTAQHPSPQPQPPPPQHPPHHHLASLTLPQLTQQPPFSQAQTPTPQQQQIQPDLTPRAPAFERSTPQGTPRRTFATTDSGGGGGGGGGGQPIFHAPARRASCSATFTLDAPEDVFADQILLSSPDAVPAYERSSNKMRLASIRLSYAEGIVGGGASSGGGPRTSQDLSSTAPSARGALATWAPQPPAGLAPPAMGRPVGPTQQVMAVAPAAAVGAAP